MSNNIFQSQSNQEPGSTFEIITDSVAQVPEELVQALNIRIVPCSIIVEGRKYKDGFELDVQALYRRMRLEKVDVHTTSPSVGEFYQVFIDRFQQGAESLLYIGLSSRLSATFSAAENGANLAREEFPGRKLLLYDSRIATIAQGFIVIEAARLARQGFLVEEVLSRIQEMRHRIGLVATLETLEYLARGGRIGKAAYMLGSLIQIHPIITIDEEGLVAPIARVRGEHEVQERMVDFIAEKVVGRQRLRMAIMEADAHASAERLKSLTQERLHPDEIFVTHFTPVMVAHAGPGMLGLAYCYD